ncbi:hypothetical protein [Arthrobacter sp. PL16]|uniref:hypothetical protein n=1 Tax=Arthrobacter sp. PL16 TaxID=3071720 RepID=UPI002E116D4D
MEIDLSKPLKDKQEEIALLQFFDAVLDFVLGEDVTDVVGKRLDRGEEVLAQVFCIADQGAEDRS